MNSKSILIAGVAALLGLSSMGLATDTEAGSRSRSHKSGQYGKASRPSLERHARQKSRVQNRSKARQGKGHRRSEIRHREVRRDHVSHHGYQKPKRYRSHRPRVHVRDYRHYTPRRVYRPWYTGSNRIIVGHDPFYLHAGLGIYLGGLALELEIGDRLPYGYVYYDPYCSETFVTIPAYRRHLRHHRHHHALTVVRTGSCDYGDGYDDYYYDD